MRLDLTTDGGQPSGAMDVPDEVLPAFEQLRKWMWQYQIRELGTLCCLSVSPRDGHLVRFPADKA
jgi:hypothetical protein